MSRTIRRKNGSKMHYLYERHYTGDIVLPEGDFGKYGSWNCGVWVPFEGKAYRKGWWRFHNDTLDFRNKMFRADWGCVRSKNRQDLYKWIKNEEHDCLFWEDVNTKDWD